MEAAIFPCNLHLLPRIPIYQSKSSDRRQLNLKDVVSSMRLVFIRDLSLKRFSDYHLNTTLDNFRSQYQTTISLTAMSTMKEETKEDSTENTEKKEEQKRSLPPPPEKPEPGDCCGNGCVRCVWDVYFEELDEYDKLCKSISDEPSSG